SRRATPTPWPAPWTRSCRTTCSGRNWSGAVRPGPRSSAGTVAAPAWPSCTGAWTPNAVGEVPSPRILMAVQQLRRAVPGGIGAYARGLLSGLAQATEAGETTDITLYASRPPRGRTGGGADPLTRFGHPVIGSRLPGPVMTRAWDHGWLRPVAGFDIIHSVSLAAPPARASRGERTVVTVHDLSWRRYPEGSTPR